VDAGAVVEGVITSKKYARLHPDTIRRIAAREVAAHPRAGLKELVKATRRGLHQVSAAFEQEPDYEAAYRRLAAAYAGGSQAEIRAACRAALALHSSTRERLPILDEFYPRLWERTGVPASILDLGCGLNPLSLPWMDLPAGARYEAFDVDAPGIEFVNRYLSLAGLEPLARWQDVLAEPPGAPAGVALLFKSGPSLERQEKGATGRLLDAIQARYVVVSYAVASLGGRDKGMVAHYRGRFLAMAREKGWAVEELLFPTEMVFIVAGTGRPSGGAG
jgi:16S rRNA (guanine(1405)-N(7))-methyltransferase